MAGMYQVVACPRCRRAKVVEPGRKQSTCGLCSRTLALRDLRAFATVGTLEEAQMAAGAVNAKLSGREREFAQALVPAAPRVARHDDRFAAAAANARRFSSEKDRADAVARALGDFGEDDLRRAFAVAGLPIDKVEAHLKRMLVADVVFEPRAGVYRAF